MYITIRKALLERFHLNSNIIGSYPQTQIFVFSFFYKDSGNTIIPFVLVGYEIGYSHLISNARSLIIILAGVLYNSYSLLWKIMKPSKLQRKIQSRNSYNKVPLNTACVSKESKLQ